MPCFCDASDEELDEARKKIRNLVIEICDTIKFISHPTDKRPELLVDALKLIEHIYAGECDEVKK